MGCFNGACCGDDGKGSVILHVDTYAHGYKIEWSFFAFVLTLSWHAHLSLSWQIEMDISIDEQVNLLCYLVLNFWTFLSSLFKIFFWIIITLLWGD